MRIDIITLFPKMFEPILNESIIKRAQEKKCVTITVHDLRDYAEGSYKQVDDRPFGGGPGMVLIPGPLIKAVKKIKGRRKAKILLMCPSGTPFQQSLAKSLSKEKSLVIICGHYEGVDERVKDLVVDECVSIGDYILTGGELASMVIVDAVTRLIPGVLGKQESLETESFDNNLLEYPQYTRPANFLGKKVPDVLLSGNHKAIKQWREDQALTRTKKFRPDLLNKKS